MIFTLRRSFTQALTVWWISPGSTVSSAPITMITSLVPCLGVCHNVALLISSAFCKLGLPFGSLASLPFLIPCMATTWSFGFPLSSLIRIHTPSYMASTHNCDMGFCSKNSRTNSCAYLSTTTKRFTGRKSFSSIASLRSRMSTMCRIMPRWKGCVSCRRLWVFDHQPACVRRLLLNLVDTYRPLIRSSLCRLISPVSLPSLSACSMGFSRSWILASHRARSLDFCFGRRGPPRGRSSSSSDCMYSVSESAILDGVDVRNEREPVGLCRKLC